MIKAGPSLEVRVVIGGVNDEKLGKIMEMEEYEELITILDSMVTAAFSEEAPEEADVVLDQT